MESSRGQEQQTDSRPSKATSQLCDLGEVPFVCKVLFYEGRVGYDQGCLTCGPQSPSTSQDRFGTGVLEFWEAVYRILGTDKHIFL